MFQRSFVLALTFAASMAFGQLDSNSLTVTATKTTSVQADQVLIAIFVDTGYDATLNDVVSLLQPAGITAANFSTVTTNQSNIIINPGTGNPFTPQPALEWSFGLPVLMSRMKETVASLSRLQADLAGKGKAMSFQVQGTQASADAQESQTCSIAGLLGDARAQAQKLADAAGMNLGVILALSSIAPTSTQSVVVPVTRYSSSSGNSYTTPCSLTVKFALSRY